MLIALRHFPDRKRPCIVLEEGNQALVLGYLTDRKREKWLRMALMREDTFQLAVRVNSLYTLDEIMEDKPQESDHKCHTCKHYTSGENDGSCGSYICKGYSNWESEGKE